MNALNLTERYLKAVAAQLPADKREDIVAELRDLLMTRMEAREAELGRPLNEAEEEAVLRDFGHPLAVASRYGETQGLVGPELYPWWLFGVKAGFAVLAAITLVGVVVRSIVGDVTVGQAITQGLHGLITGAVTIVGLLTIAGFFIERQATKPAFLTRWRVQDLGLFELGGLSGDAWSEQLAKACERGRRPREDRAPHAAAMSPSARAVSSAVGWSVALLWWTGALGASIAPSTLAGGVMEGVDYGRIASDLVALSFWPVLAYMAARIAFDLMRAATGSPVRLTAAGDVAFAGAGAVFAAWLWLASPLSSVIWVGTVEDFVTRVTTAFSTGEGVIAAIIMMSVAGSFIGETWRMISAALRLVTGRDGRQAC